MHTILYVAGGSALYSFGRVSLHIRSKQSLALDLAELGFVRRFRLAAERYCTWRCLSLIAWRHCGQSGRLDRFESARPALYDRVVRVWFIGILLAPASDRISDGPSLLRSKQQNN